MKVLPLRPNVCLLICNAVGQLFLGERAGCPGVWQFPQGGVESHLSLEENALKEAHEEMGVPLVHLRIIKKLNATHAYEFDVVPEYAIGKWRGQAQSFWLLAYSGSDSEIDLSQYDAEFMNWKWCSVSEVKQLAEPKRLPGYLAALSEYEEWAREA
ncbi:MAG: NUDIX domain-containing protein [Deltaproteobacteria bacterium]|nr:NUDIX domain-containing protein [Deltaproteobacteria bacterium]